MGLENQKFVLGIRVTCPLAVIPKYGKNNSKFFISGTDRPMTWKFGMQHLGLWLYLVYSNDDSWLT